MAGRHARDYYGASALPDIHSGQRACPFPRWLHETRATPDSSHVHHTTVRRWSAPNSAPAASPRLRRGPSPWPPTERNCSGSEFPTSSRRTVRTATQPISARFELVGRLRSFTRWFHAYAFPSRLPDPHRLAVPARPGVVGAAFRPSRRLPGQAAPRFTRLPRQPSGAGLSPPPGHAAPRGARCRRPTCTHSPHRTGHAG